MTDREKVIRAVDSCFNYWLDQHRCLNPLELEHVRQYKAEALALLKEQEAVEPSVDVDTYVCPSCGHRLEHQGMLGDNVIFDERYNFCPACGKAVKWDG